MINRYINDERNLVYMLQEEGMLVAECFHCFTGSFPKGLLLTCT